jgi:spore coat polysaccharide biosynthesis protein SpsF
LNNGKTDFHSQQEQFWAGEFGNDYIRRNQGSKLLAANLSFFGKALALLQSANSCIEFGANIGMNLKALKLLFPDQEQHAIEINPIAHRELGRLIQPDHAFQGSILDYPLTRTFELVLIKGVLIHINPELLPQVYDQLVAACGRYLLVAEYYNPVPVAIPYRGHSERLFKRDFAGELLDHHSELKLLDYGFVYHRDPVFPQDDVNWFLLEKRGA